MAAIIFRLDDGSLYRAFDTDNPTTRNFNRTKGALDERTGAPLGEWEDEPVIAPDDVLAAKGFAVVRGLPPLDDTHKWDPETRTVITVALPVEPRLVSRATFLFAFQPAEFARIIASEDPAVRQFVFVVQGEQTINMESPIVKNGLGYLAQQGLIDQERVAVIGALKE
jgi:hypothetical protein